MAWSKTGWIAASFVVVTLASGQKSTRKAPTNEVLLWNQVLLEAASEGQHPPPMNARNLAILSIAQFDALNSIQPRFRKYRFQRKKPLANQEAAIIGASLTVMRELYTARQSAANKLYKERMKALGNGKDVAEGFALGVESAQTILAERAGDGHIEAAFPYESQMRIGEYREPEGADVKIPTPAWGDIKPFCLKRGNEFRPNRIELFGPVYTASLAEVRRIGARVNAERTPDQAQTARFWSFGSRTITPPGAWNEIAGIVAKQKELPLLETSRLMALLNIALADAGIAAWDAKYWYVIWRPQTAIRLADKDPLPETVGDPQWSSFLPTPNHPSYVSGHSAFSMAAAAVLSDFFRTDSIKFTYQGDKSQIKTLRSYWSFTSAAKEAGRSRVFGGIHYQFDNLAGAEMGYKIGSAVFEMELRPL
jgi:membrane-associated phospholipid phosphatase